MREARAAATAAAEDARRQGLGEEEQRAAAEAAANEVLTELPAADHPARDRVRPERGAAARRPDLRQLGGLRPGSARASRSRASSIFWPSADAAQILVRLKPDLSESERSEAIDLIRDAVGDDAFAIRNAEYVVSGAPVVVDGLADELSSAIVVLLLAAAGGDDRDPGARLRPARAAAAAGRRPGRRGDHLRPAGALRRLADDGLDRRAADPDRARGRLRDPVPGPVQRGACGRLVAGPRRGRGGGPRRAGDRDRGARDRRRVPRPAALADPDGPRLRPPARRRDRDRVRGRAHRRAGAAVADRSARAQRAEAAGRASAPGRRASPPSRGARERASRLGSARIGSARAGGVGGRAGPGARGRARRRRRRLGG